MHPLCDFPDRHLSYAAYLHVLLWRGAYVLLDRVQLDLAPAHPDACFCRERGLGNGGANDESLPRGSLHIRVGNADRFNRSRRQFRRVSVDHVLLPDSARLRQRLSVVYATRMAADPRNPAEDRRADADAMEIRAAVPLLQRLPSGAHRERRPMRHRVRPRALRR